MRIALIRHPTPAIAPGICYGRRDVGLSPAAEPQIAHILSQPDLLGAASILTSPARRCRLLADRLAAALNAPLSEDERLHELHFGAWEGQAWDAIDRAELDRWASGPERFAPPGGESGAELIARVRDFHADLHRKRQDCIVVSHGGPLKILAALLTAVPVDLLAPAPPLGSVRIVTG